MVYSEAGSPELGPRINTVRPSFVCLLASVSGKWFYFHIQIKDTILLGTETAFVVRK